jgi:predicted regulator of Ras-like GTPase activity (Roadblock/LC7/MglB family)
MILDKITIALNVVIAACAFSTGWTLARYIDAVQAEKVAAIALQDKLERDKVVIKQQADLILYQEREAEIKRQADEGERNANTIIDNLMRDADKRSGVRVVSVKGICTNSLPPSDSPASSVSSASTVFDAYDASVDQLRHDTLEAVRACEIDRESVIRQAGGR